MKNKKSLLKSKKILLRKTSRYAFEGIDYYEDWVTKVWNVEEWSLQGKLINKTHLKNGFLYGIRFLTNKFILINHFS